MGLLGKLFGRSGKGTQKDSVGNTQSAMEDFLSGLDDGLSAAGRSEVKHAQAQPTKPRKRRPVRPGIHQVDTTPIPSPKFSTDGRPTFPEPSKDAVKEVKKEKSPSNDSWAALDWDEE